MKLIIEHVSIGNFIGGIAGWLMLKKSGFESAYYVGEADTVLVRKDYISIRTRSKSKRYIESIARHFLGKTSVFKITKKDGIVDVERVVT